jgi:sulfoxide reductase heme-binding subunit YedZ
MTALWYATRGTGVVALLLLTATVVLGIAATARFATPRWPRLMTAGLHRHLSLLVLAFVAVHVATAVLDPFAPIGWAAAVVPFGATYRPLWLGLGAVAFDLLIAVVVTSLLRARLGYRTWRAVHWLAYASWPVALWHGLGTGTDSRLTPMIGLDAACAAAVACAAAWRISLLPSVRRRLAASSACLAIALATVTFMAAGPLQPGWARRAGTPVRLLTPNAASAATWPRIIGRAAGLTAAGQAAAGQAAAGRARS